MLLFSAVGKAILATAVLVITALSLALLAVIAARVLAQFEGNPLTIRYVMAAAITVSSASISLVRRLIWQRQRQRSAESRNSINLPEPCDDR